MLETLLYIIISGFALVGLWDLYCFLEAKLLLDKHKLKTVIVVQLSGHEEQAEYILRCALSQARRYEGRGSATVCVVDNGMDEQTRALCKTIESECSSVSLCSPDRLEQQILNNN